MAGMIDADMLGLQIMEVGNEVMNLQKDVSAILSYIDEEKKLRLSEEDPVPDEPGQESLERMDSRILGFRKKLIATVVQGFLCSKGIRKLSDEELSILSSQLMYAMDGTIHIPDDDIPF